MTRLEQIQQFLKDSPNDPFLHYALAQEYQKAGDIESCQQSYEYLIEHHPNYVATYYHLGKMYLAANQRDKALELFEMGIAIAKQLKEQHALSELMSIKLEVELDED